MSMFLDNFCEENVPPAQKIDIEKIWQSQADSFKVAEVTDEPLKSPRDFLSETDDSLTVLPSFQKHHDHLKPLLSIQKNKYMALKWAKFLDNVPDQYVTIKVCEPPKMKDNLPRRKNLNGQFYGHDFKLAPIPVAEDPRLIIKPQEN